MNLYGFDLRKYDGSSRSGEECPGITSGFSQMPKPDQVSDYKSVLRCVPGHCLKMENMALGFLLKMASCMWIIYKGPL